MTAPGGPPSGGGNQEPINDPKKHPDPEPKKDKDKDEEKE